MYDKNTDELLNILKSTHSTRELDSYRSQYAVSDSELSFSALFNQLLSEKHLSKAEIIKKSLLDRTYTYQILNGTRLPGRNKVLALCIAAGLSLNETQRLLECAKEGILYSRSSRDAIIIYGITHQLNLMKINELLYEKQEAVIE